MWKVYLSRWINHRLLGGKKNQMVSSRVYVEHHVIWEQRIDCVIFWHVRHCRRSFLWEVQYEAKKKRLEETKNKTQPTTSHENGLACLSKERGVL